ncbi:MAG: hypothetical protein RDV41_07575 [Planctomycetota bacterium]|nr:hypothetical protein [Planctomycetota bacterium]
MRKTRRILLLAGTICLLTCLSARRIPAEGEDGIDAAISKTREAGSAVIEFSFTRPGAEPARAALRGTLSIPQANTSGGTHAATRSRLTVQLCEVFSAQGVNLGRPFAAVLVEGDNVSVKGAGESEWKEFKEEHWLRPIFKCPASLFDNLGRIAESAQVKEVTPAGAQGAGALRFFLGEIKGTRVREMLERDSGLFPCTWLQSAVFGNAGAACEVTITIGADDGLVRGVKLILWPTKGPELPCYVAEATLRDHGKAAGDPQPGAARAEGVVFDGAYLRALDGAFCRAVLWKARRQARGVGPAVKAVTDLFPKDKDAQELLKTASKEEPSDAERADFADLAACFARRYAEFVEGTKGVVRLAADCETAGRRADRLEKLLREYGGPAEAADRDACARAAAELLSKYRVAAGLKAVELDKELSKDCQTHANYLDLNRGEGDASYTFRDAPHPHMEVPGLPGYSLNGDMAGRASNIAFGTPAHVVECQVTASFYHRIPLLHPDLATLGVGYVRSAPCPRCNCDRIAVLGMGTRGGGSTGGKEPGFCAVVFPPDGATDVPRRYGVEWPNPIEDAPKDDKGLSIGGCPVTVSFFGAGSVEVMSARIEDAAGKEVPCYLSSATNPARKEFPQDESICLIAKEILAPNATYKVHVSAKVNEEDWERTWSFRTGEKLLPEEE